MKGGTGREGSNEVEGKEGREEGRKGHVQKTSVPLAGRRDGRGAAGPSLVRAVIKRRRQGEGHVREECLDISEFSLFY